MEGIIAQHVSPDGNIRPCVGADRCKYKNHNNGKGVEHFSNVAEAKAWVEKDNESKYDKFNNYQRQKKVETYSPDHIVGGALTPRKQQEFQSFINNTDIKEYYGLTSLDNKGKTTYFNGIAFGLENETEYNYYGYEMKIELENEGYDTDSVILVDYKDKEKILRYDLENETQSKHSYPYNAIQNLRATGKKDSSYYNRLKAVAEIVDYKGNLTNIDAVEKHILKQHEETAKKTGRLKNFQYYGNRTIVLDNSKSGYSNTNEAYNAFFDKTIDSVNIQKSEFLSKEGNDIVDFKTSSYEFFSDNKGLTMSNDIEFVAEDWFASTKIDKGNSTMKVDYNSSGAFYDIEANGMKAKYTTKNKMSNFPATNKNGEKGLITTNGDRAIFVTKTSRTPYPDMKTLANDFKENKILDNSTSIFNTMKNAVTLANNATKKMER